MVGDVPAGTLDGEVGGRRRLGRLGLRRKRASRLRPVEDRAQVDGGVDGGRAPHRVAGTCRDRLPLQGQEAGNGSAGEHPAGVSQPHLVGHEHEDGAGERAVAQPPHPVGEGRPVGGEAPAHDAHGAPVRQRHGGVQGAGPEPAEAYGVGDAGDGGGQPVDDGQGVEPLHQDAPPRGGDGPVSDQLVGGRVLLPGQAFKPVGGEVEPSRRGHEVGGVGDRCGEPAVLQPLHGLVDRSPGPAGDGDHLQAVEKWHLCQGAEQLLFTSAGLHSFASSSLSFRLLT